MPITDLEIPLIHSLNHVSCQLGEELVVLNTLSGAYSKINPTGAIIWEKIGHSKATNAIIEELKAEYDQSPERIEKEALDFIDTLLQKNLIQITSKK